MEQMNNFTRETHQHKNAGTGWEGENSSSCVLYIAAVAILLAQTKEMTLFSVT